MPEDVPPEPVVAASPPPEAPAEAVQPEVVVAAPPPPPPPAAPEPAAAVAQPAAKLAPQAAVAKPAGQSKAPLIVLGALVLILVAVAGLWFGGYADRIRGLIKLPGSGDSSPQGGPPVVDGGGRSSDPAAIKAALIAGLPSIGCTWLDVSDMSQSGSKTVVALHGVAGNPTDAQAQITRMLATKNLNVGTIDFGDVASIESSECGPLDALRQIRDPAGGRISVPQRKIEMTKLATGDYAGSLGAKAVIEFNLSDPGQEMALFGIEPSGKVSQLTAERSELVGASEKLGGDRYRLPIDVNHTGWSGMLLLTGQKPFDDSRLAGPAGSRSGEWSSQFLTEAKARGWKAEMVWFETVDEQPN